MSYVSLEDDFHSNPKVLAAGLDGAGLYARALSYCGAFLTDGFLPRAWMMGATEGKRSPITKCLAAGLIIERGSDYAIRDYLEHNPSREQVLERRAERSESGKKGAAKRWTGREKKPAAQVGASLDTSNSSSDSSSHGNSDSSHLANEWHSTPTSSPPSEEISEAKASSPKPTEIAWRLFELWKETWGHHRSILTPARRKLVERRLKDGFTEETMAAAIRGSKADAGRWPERNAPQAHTFELILRDGAHIEPFAVVDESPNGNGRVLTDAEKHIRDLADMKAREEAAHARLAARRED